VATIHGLAKVIFHLSGMRASRGFGLVIKRGYGSATVMGGRGGQRPFLFGPRGLVCTLVLLV